MALADLLKGYGGEQFPLPKIAGTYKGKKLCIVADAACVWDDLERLGCKYVHKRGAVAHIEFQFMTVNGIVMTFPGNIEHAYSNQPDILDKFIAARRHEYSREFEGPRHTHSIRKGVMHRWPWSGHGTSLLGACFAGIGMGYDAIVICGGPLDDGPHNGEPYWRKCAFTNEAAAQGNGVNLQWKRAMDLAFEGRVFSMSGRTRDWLGSPAG
jgi:hypothetical protein